MFKNLLSLLEKKLGALVRAMIQDIEKYPALVYMIKMGCLLVCSAVVTEGILVKSYNCFRFI